MNIITLYDKTVSDQTDFEPHELQHSKPLTEKTVTLSSGLVLKLAMGTAAVAVLARFAGAHSVSRLFGRWVSPLLFVTYSQLLKIERGEFEPGQNTVLISKPTDNH